MTANGFGPLIRDRAFGRLWFIQASTQIGGNMSLYALTILVFATTRSNAAVSALVMSFLLPTILLSAVAGVLVDRLDVRWAMIVPKAQLQTAMGIFNLTLQASFAVGFAFLGPIVVAMAGPSVVLVVVTVFYAAATITTLFLPSAPP